MNGDGGGGPLHREVVRNDFLWEKRLNRRRTDGGGDGDGLNVVAAAAAVVVAAVCIR